MSALRAVVLGCGTIGTGSGAAPLHDDLGVWTHAAAYAACEATVLAGVADLDPERASAAARAWGTERHATDPTALLVDAAPELVSVCTPDATHAELVGLALRTPGVRGVLAEKPLALDAREARELVAVARDRGVVLAVNYTRRFAPAFAALRAGLAEAIGILQHVGGSYGKGLAHNGTHWLDLLRMLVGDPVAVRGWDRLGEGGEDPTLEAALTLAGGAGARLAGLDAGCFTHFEMDLVGTRGRVRILESGHRIERWSVGPDPRHAGHRALRPSVAVDAALRDSTLHAVADLAAAVRGGRAPACTGGDAVAALELAGAIRESATQGVAILS